MSYNLVLIIVLTFIVQYILIASLSVRIVSIRTKKISTSNSLFNLIFLIAQFATTIQIPLLTKYVEKTILSGTAPDNLVFRMIIFSSTIGAICGAISIPTIHRFMERGVDSLYNNNSIFKIVIKSIKLSTITHFKKSVKIPNKNNYTRLINYKNLRLDIIFLNIIVYCFSTVSVVSCLYAGYLNPEFRTTSLSLSGLAAAIGAVGMLMFVEPYNSILTDKVINGEVSDSFFRKHLTFVVLARIIGTIGGQFLFIPLSQFISKIATFL